MNGTCATINLGDQIVVVPFIRTYFWTPSKHEFLLVVSLVGGGDLHSFYPSKDEVIDEVARIGAAINTYYAQGER